MPCVSTVFVGKTVPFLAVIRCVMSVLLLALLLDGDIGSHERKLWKAAIDAVGPDVAVCSKPWPSPASFIIHHSSFEHCG